MARSSDQVNTIIEELKTARGVRDTALEEAAVALDGTNDKHAKRLRNVKHTDEIARGVEICVKCKILRHADSTPYGQEHMTYFIDDKVLDVDTTAPGLKTRLADESFTVPNATTVENL